jgi:hypothetical protein
MNDKTLIAIAMTLVVGTTVSVVSAQTRESSTDTTIQTQTPTIGIPPTRGRSRDANNASPETSTPSIGPTNPDQPPAVPSIGRTNPSQPATVPSIGTNNPAQPRSVPSQ